MKLGKKVAAGAVAALIGTLAFGASAANAAGSIEDESISVNEDCSVSIPVWVDDTASYQLDIVQDESTLFSESDSTDDPENSELLFVWTPSPGFFSGGDPTVQLRLSDEGGLLDSTEWTFPAESFDRCGGDQGGDTGSIGEITRAECLVSIPVSTQGPGPFWIEVWDDGANIYTSPEFDAGEHTVPWVITAAAGKGASGVGIVLLGGEGSYLDYVDPYEFPDEVLAVCSAVPDPPTPPAIVSTASSGPAAAPAAPFAAATAALALIAAALVLGGRKPMPRK